MTLILGYRSTTWSLSAKTTIYIKQPTSYKNADSPTCIDLTLSNVPRGFQSTYVIETGPSYFHLMTVAVIKKSLKYVQTKDCKLQVLQKL